MSKTEADSLLKISTAYLKRYDYFCGRRSGTVSWTNGWNGHRSSVGIEVSTENGDGSLRLLYSQTNTDDGIKNDFDYKIPLITTPCHYGGKRYWFVCPMFRNQRYCGRKVATLYKSGNYFACRHCHNLTYNSRKVNRRYRMFPLQNIVNLEEKIKDLQKQIKRHYYKGKPTRKQRKLEKLYEQAGTNYAKLTNLEH